MAEVQVHTIVEAFAMQANASEAHGSAMYALLHRELGERYVSDPAARTLRALLTDRTMRPVHDAVVLRLAGAVHRIVLRGAAPDLARHYPTAGGEPGNGFVDDFLNVIVRHRGEIDLALDQQVQTNEVGRSAVLAGGFALVGRRFGLPLELFELGASAGLNLRWDRFWYDTGETSIGDPSSVVRFTDVWPAPPALSKVDIAARHGCDIAPLDAQDPAARLRLLSFVWPDQLDRYARLKGALAIASQIDVAVERADAGEWLGRLLPRRAVGAAAVVYHSIVWQYMPRATKNTVREALDHWGSRATVEHPLAWLRMEPDGARASLRLRTWPGGHDEVLATATFHGADIRWTGPSI
jgi:hypothetical protein